jgi:predicted ATPase/DNA-binding SARP family transcriptional activator
MDFQILGPLQVSENEQPLPLVGAKQRALLALLLLSANEPVSIDRLIEEVWGEEPPERGRKSLQVHVSRLRKALGAADGPVITRPNAYLIRVERGELDLERFERLAEEGREALASGDPQRAAERLAEGLQMWRGPPLADLAFESFAQAEIGRLEELRLAVLEDRIEADLACGRHAELVAEIEALVTDHPLRERLRRQIVLALYRAGRQADALAAYRAASAMLLDELGLEPTPELRRLEQAILTHDPSIEAPAMTRTSRLPAPPTRTIGRDEDRESVVDLLGRDDVRLVTLIGPGGVGKTRLALEVAWELEPELPDGAWFVSLAGTAKGEHVPSAIAQALGVTALPGETPSVAIRRFLGARRGLLVLDNFEHLLSAASLVSELATACAPLKLLATSREALRLQAEQRYVLAPLDLPADGHPQAVERAAAGALFTERARGHDQAFEVTEGNAGAIAEICRRLDGLPLAIELAAARAALFGAEELNRRLAEASDALGSGPRDAPDRQRTLRATIDWSHQLLSPAEADAFARFAVFAGGSTIEAAQGITGAGLDVLEGLVDKQLLLRRSGSGGEARLLMLETVREYAGERLEGANAAAETHDRHCRHYLALVERAEPELLTRGEAEWLPRLDAEVDNLRAALEWSLTQGEPASGLRLAGLLGRFWEIRNSPAEGLRWIEAALNQAGYGAPIADRARARRAQVRLLGFEGPAYNWQGSRAEVAARADEALALSREAGDPSGVAEALVALAGLEMAESQPQRRRRALAEEALRFAREAGDDRLIALALTEASLTLAPEPGAAQLESAAAALRKIGSTRELALLYSNAAYDAIIAGSADVAGSLLDQAVPLARDLGEPVALALVYGNVGLKALFAVDLDRARDAFGEQLGWCRRDGVRWLAAEALSGLAAIAAHRGDFDRAARLLGAATTAGPWDGDPDVARQLEEQFFAPARAVYGDDRWNEARATGAQLGFDQSIAFALSFAKSGR